MPPILEVLAIELKFVLSFSVFPLMIVPCASNRDAQHKDPQLGFVDYRCCTTTPPKSASLNRMSLNDIYEYDENNLDLYQKWTHPRYTVFYNDVPGTTGIYC